MFSSRSSSSLSLPIVPSVVTSATVKRKISLFSGLEGVSNSDFMSTNLST
jgi:hypothetical protein